jgi:transposase-like protein
MARQEDCNALLAIWQEAKATGDDPIRALLERLLQELLEAQMTAHLGAEPYERGEGRRGHRNGYKPRQLKTRVGRLELRVPQDREGRFRTELFEWYQRSEKALVLALVQMVLEGVSTRKVRRITEKLCGETVSRSQVSALTAALEAEVSAWRSRPLEGRWPYLVVDARYEKVRRQHRVVSQAVLTVVGISVAGYREVLGTYLGDSESETTWGEVFQDLKARGLSGVVYVVSDDHEGLRRAVARHFQGAVWQRCQVHLVRNLLAKVSKADRPWVLDLWRMVRDARTLSSAEARLGELVAALEKGGYGPVAEWLETAGAEALAVYALPPEHRVRLRSTNLLERWHEEVKRRTRVVRIFPNGASCLRLVTALAMETSEQWQERRYLRMDVASADEPPAAAAEPDAGQRKRAAKEPVAA